MSEFCGTVIAFCICVREKVFKRERTQNVQARIQELVDADGGDRSTSGFYPDNMADLNPLPDQSGWIKTLPN